MGFSFNERIDGMALTLQICENNLTFFFDNSVLIL